jgi:hypothetical protein
MKLYLSDLCTCGDTLGQHAPEPLAWCSVQCFIQYPQSTQWQHHFKKDNLRYLEKEYESQVVNNTQKQVAN